MNKLEMHRYEMAIRVCDFGSTHLTDLPVNSSAGRVLAEIKEIKAVLTGHNTEKSSATRGSRESTTVKSVLRAALREDLIAISRTAASLAQDIPGLANKFRMPDSESDQALLSTARSFAKDAAPFAEQFIDYYIPSDFLDDLKADIEKFEQLLSESNATHENKVMAREAIDDQMELLMKAVKRLDAIVKNKYRSEPLVLAAWNRAKHVERISRTSHSETAPPPTDKPGTN